MLNSNGFSPQVFSFFAIDLHFCANDFRFDFIFHCRIREIVCVFWNSVEMRSRMATDRIRGVCSVLCLREKKMFSFLNILTLTPDYLSTIAVKIIIAKMSVYECAWTVYSLSCYMRPDLA